MIHLFACDYRAHAWQAVIYLLHMISMSGNPPDQCFLIFYYFVCTAVLTSREYRHMRHLRIMPDGHGYILTKKQGTLKVEIPISTGHFRCFLIQSQIIACVHFRYQNSETGTLL